MSATNYRAEIEAIAGPMHLDPDVIELSDCLLRRGATMKAHVDLLAADSEHSARSRDRHTAAVNDDEHVFPGIAVLLSSRRPSAVSGLVMSFVVDPIEQSTPGARSHVAHEGGEVARPRFLHRDSTAAVVSEGSIARGEAPPLGVLPRLVLARHATPSPSAVPEIHSLGVIEVQAPTRLCSAGAQCRPHADHSGATIAATQPSSFAVGDVMARLHDESPESQPAYIN
jgi:hypothetical protein